jgi:RNA polymerase sigma factor (sigma-70 family)
MKRYSRMASMRNLNKVAAPEEMGRGAHQRMEKLLAHLDSAYNLARWLMRSDEDAEDIVQEAYLRAFRFHSALRADDGRAWLLTIVRNACYDSLRLNGTTRLFESFNEELHCTRQETVDAETSLLQKERARTVRLAVEDLPPELREVLVLRELEELSYKEIARIAEIPVGTVMSRLSRGRKRLQLRLPTQAEGGQNASAD